MRFRFSPHAERELTRRKLNRTKVLEIARNPDRKVPGRGGRIIREGIFEWNGKRRLLRIVVDEDVDPPCIVTVYQTSKINKYRRQA